MCRTRELLRLHLRNCAHRLLNPQHLQYKKLPATPTTNMYELTSLLGAYKSHYDECTHAFLQMPDAHILS